MSDTTAPLGPRVDGARGDEMRERMQASVEAEDCDFCKVVAGEPSRHHSPVFFEGRHWLATNNDFPYPGTKDHVLIISRDHVNDLRDLSNEALAEGMQIWVSVVDYLGLKGYCPFGRIGDRNLTAQTIPHLCFHITESDGLPVNIESIDSEMRHVIEGLPAGMSEDPEALKKFWEAISLWRSWLEGKAIGIYPKLSNKATKP